MNTDHLCRQANRLVVEIGVFVKCIHKWLVCANVDTVYVASLRICAHQPLVQRKTRTIFRWSGSTAVDNPHLKTQFFQDNAWKTVHFDVSGVKNGFSWAHADAQIWAQSLFQHILNILQNIFH